MTDDGTGVEDALMPAGTGAVPPLTSDDVGSSSPDAPLPDVAASDALPSDPAAPEQSSTPGPDSDAAPQAAEALPPSHGTPNALDRRGDAFMRVLSRSLDDLAALTRGQRVATHEETGAAVRHAMLMEGVVQRPVAKDDSQPAAPSLMTRDRLPPDGAAPPSDPQDAAQTAPARSSFSFDGDTMSELEKKAREEAQRPPAPRDQPRSPPVQPDASVSGALGDNPPPGVVSPNDQNDAKMTAGGLPQDLEAGVPGTSATSASDFIPIGPEGTGDIAAGFLKQADQPDAPAWLEDHLQRFPLQSVVDNFTRSQDISEITSVRDTALRFVEDNPDLTMTKIFVDELGKYIGENQDIVVVAKRGSHAKKRSVTGPATSDASPVSSPLSNRPIAHRTRYGVVTFHSMTKDGVRSDQPVRPALATALDEILSSNEAFRSVNVYATTNGHTKGDHVAGSAVDINIINGVHVGLGGLGYENAIALKQAAMQHPNVRYVEGPGGNFSRSSPGAPFRRSKNLDGMNTHVHIGVFR